MAAADKVKVVTGDVMKLSDVKAAFATRVDAVVSALGEAWDKTSNVRSGGLKNICDVRL